MAAQCQYTEVPLPCVQAVGEKNHRIRLRTKIVVNMNIVILTQEEHFAIPRNVEKVVELEGGNVPLIVILDTKGSLMNRKSYFVKGFGLLQSAKMAVRLSLYKTVDALDRLFGGKLFTQKRSVQAVAKKYGIPCLKIGSPNKRDFLTKLSEMNPDIVLSFSAPVIFKEELLSIPKQGCMNLHCSWLPEYAGLLPSFWALFEEASATGATLHYMDDRIDNGGIISRIRVPIDQGMSMFDLIQSTKRRGGDMVCDVLKRVIEGEEIDTQPNEADPDNYYTWPTVEQMRDFRRKGGRLI